MRSDCWWVDPVKLLVSMALFWLRFQHAMPPQVSICTGIDGSTQAHVVGGQAFGGRRLECLEAVRGREKSMDLEAALISLWKIGI